MKLKSAVFLSLVFSVSLLCTFFILHNNIAHAQPELNFVNSAGQREGFWRVTAAMLQLSDRPDTALVEEGRYFANEKDGAWNTYYANGYLKSVITYKNGELHGKTLLYNENNIAVKEVEYENGVPQGLMLTYYPDGTLWTKTTWKKGRIDGPATTYYPNGKVYEEGIWQYNYWTGPYTLYSESGQVIRKETKPPTMENYMIK